MALAKYIAGKAISAGRIGTCFGEHDLPLTTPIDINAEY
jgi:hypothetical protein